MFEISVGKPYTPNRTEYLEGCEYNFFKGGHELKLFFTSPTQQEIEAIRRGKANFGLVVEGNIIYLLFQFESLDWSDAPYSWWRVSEASRAEPTEISEGHGALMQIVLIDASTGIVKAIRALGLETEFSRALNAAIANQMESPLSQQEHDQAIDRMYAKYRNSESMLRNAIAQNLS